MKKIFTILLYSTLVLTISCKENHTKHIDNKKVKDLANLCKIWGVLKYYHPLTSDSLANWDSVLIQNIDRVMDNKNPDSLKYIFNSIIPNLEVIKTNDLSNYCENDSAIFINQDFSWIYDSSCFTLETIENIEWLINNRIPYKNKYISANPYVLNPIFDSDTSYTTIVYPDKNVRLLSLFRYWNMINYFYPYKYLTDHNWEDVLEMLIPIFINAKDSVEYNLAVCRLTAMINDNHGYTTSRVLSNLWGINFLPVKFELIEGITVITEFYSDSLALINNLKLGDVILEKNGLAIEKIRDSLSQYFSGSNEYSIQNTISYFLTRTPNNSVALKINRDDSIISNVSEAYSRDIISNERKKKKPLLSVKEIIPDVYYVNLSKIKYEEVDSIFNNLISSKALIIDLRFNCSFVIHKLCNILFEEEFTFYNYSKPNYVQPSLFCYATDGITGPSEKNDNYYKGKLLILVDGNTQSIGEFTTMALKMHENALIIGNPTAGADGNVSLIYLPGELETYISGIGIYWNDGRETQRIGIQPDVLVYPKISSIFENKDDILNKAIELIKNEIK